MKKILAATAAALALLTFPAPNLRAEVTPDDKKLWVGQFDQCSFDAISSVLAHFYGNIDTVPNRTNFEKEAFNAPLDTTGMGAYYGWAPWTSYMLNSGKMTWNNKPVTDLVAERFSLATKILPKVKGDTVLVKYAPGERDALKAKLLSQLKRGPVIIWTPYAAGALGKNWKHVTSTDPNTDAVLFNPGLTHAVTIFLKPGDKLIVTDCSAKNGVYDTDLDTVVSTAAAMSASVRIKRGEKSIFDNGLKGIQNDEFDVVFFKKEAKNPTAKP